MVSIIIIWYEDGIYNNIGIGMISITIIYYQYGIYNNMV